MAGATGVGARRIRDISSDAAACKRLPVERSVRSGTNPGAGVATPLDLESYATAVVSLKDGCVCECVYGSDPSAGDQRTTALDRRVGTFHTVPGAGIVP